MYIKRTEKILHYEELIRENVRQRERMKQEITQMENEQTKGRFWKEKHRMLTAGTEYFNACAEYYMLLAELEYIKEEDKTNTCKGDFRHTSDNFPT